MKKKILNIPFIIFFIILLVFFYLLIIDRNPSEVPSVLIDKKAPEFKAQSLLKKENFISYKEFENETVLVNFFDTWCKPCRDEHIYIKKISDEGKAKIIGINYKDNPEKAIQWLAKVGNPYSSIAIDRKGEVAIDWGVYGIPETFIINSKGFIKYRHVGPINKKIYKKISLIIEENYK
jgi:cytochrome c biogenesis protein CcmG, thiol:disulfide interchange protein DsbE